MRTENVMYFTEKEEEFANLLIEIGTKRNVAKVLVFLANTPEATSRAIERGTSYTVIPWQMGIVAMSSASADGVSAQMAKPSPAGRLPPSTPTPGRSRTARS